MKKRALLSVSDKRGITTLAGELVKLGYEVVSTGGTFKAITDAGVEATYVTEITGFPEILGGRVKTLHPFVHGGILAMRNEEHLAQLAELGIVPIDLVVVNLYPFKQTIAKEGVTIEDAIENIDIGGPTMVRAAAKNCKDVAIVVNPERYEEVVEKLKAGTLDADTRLSLSLEAFSHTAEYDTYISNYLRGVVNKDEAFSPHIVGELKQGLRYGENPHQKAAFYAFADAKEPCVANAKQLQGKELSFNNIVDLNAALELVREFSEPATVIVKHTNPCGTALGSCAHTSYLRAYEADPVSAFGGIVAMNKIVNVEVANEMVKTFLEAVIAPGFTEEALEVLAVKPNLRLMELGEFTCSAGGVDIKAVNGGFLVQDKDVVNITPDMLKIVTETKPTDDEVEELIFAMKVVKHVKSNAIVISKDKQIIGVGAGQMNRVGSAKIAFEQAGDKAKGAVLASDAFFPFRDTVDEAAKNGIKAIIQPGGSMRDAESVDACNEMKIPMVMTGIRHFKH